MKKIIDFHSHMGDIFHENRNVTFKQNVKPGNYENPFIKQEKSGFIDPLIGTDLEEFQILTKAGQYLCWENTLENLSKKLDENNITNICLYPILPNTSFEEYLAASKLDNRLLPFTSADYNLPIDDMVEKLKKDIRNGAKGLKIHPVLQNISLQDRRVHAAIEVFGNLNLPITSHCGANDYYSNGETFLRNPEAGDVKYFIELVHKYPNFVLVAAHCGGLMGGEMEILSDGIKGLENVYVDTTFRSAKDILREVDFFGRDKVLFGTDTPFSTHKGAINEVKMACINDSELEEMILYKNAAHILHI